MGVYGLLGQHVADAIATFTGLDVPWWAAALVAVVIVWFVGRRGIDVGAKILGVLLVAETAILALLAGAVIVQGGAPDTSALSAASFSPEAMFAPGMIGVCSRLLRRVHGLRVDRPVRPEARSAARSIPRATYGAVVFMGLFYCLIVWAIIQAYGNEGVLSAAAADPASLFFVAIEQYVGPWASDVMYVDHDQRAGLADRLPQCDQPLHVQPGPDGLLPAKLAHTHPRFGSPSVAGAVQSILAAVVIAASSPSPAPTPTRTCCSR